VWKNPGVTESMLTSRSVVILLSAKIVIGLFQLPPVRNANRAIADDWVIDDARIASSMRRISSFPSAGEYPLRNESTPNETRLVVEKPGPLAINASRLRRNSAAPTTSVN